MKSIIVILSLNLLLISKVVAQKNAFAFHIYNPVAMFQKAGIKLEYRHQQTGLLLSGIQYYGSWPKYPGTQAALEGRIYKKLQGAKVHENFIYSKIIYGYQQHANATGDGFFRRAEVLAGNYYGAGIGVGRHFNYGHFFIDINLGFKYTLSESKQATPFYITGPGSYLDLHFNIGFQ